MASESAKPEKSTFDDVRMRGFRSRSKVDDALAWIDGSAMALGYESIPLMEAAGRILAEDMSSECDVPSYRRAMMDGFALHTADTMGATNYNPLSLTVIGSVLPGQSFDGEVQRGQAVSIMTGAPIPNGADAVLPAEKVSREEDKLTVLDEDMCLTVMTK